MNPLSNLNDSEILEFQYIYNLLQRYKGRTKFFDLRCPESFKSLSMRGSINISQDPSLPLSINLSQLTKERELSRLRRFCIVIGYTSEYHSLSVTLSEMLASLKCKEVHQIHDIEKFFNRYSFLCSAELSVKDFPNEIIPGFLYLGTAEHAHSFETLEVLKVTHILNATKSLASPFSGLRYCRVDVEDKETEKIGTWFAQAFEFIGEAAGLCGSGQQAVVLVHCAKGVSRSATLVVMYLMKAACMTLQEALAFTKRHREVIEPNDGFMSELQEFERNNKEFVRVVN